MCQINVHDKKHAKIQRLNCHFAFKSMYRKGFNRRQRLISRADRDVQLCKNILNCDTHTKTEEKEEKEEKDEGREAIKEEVQVSCAC